MSTASVHTVNMILNQVQTSVIQMFGRCSVFAVLLSKLVSEHVRWACLETTLQKHCIRKKSELPRSNQVVPLEEAETQEEAVEANLKQVEETEGKEPPKVEEIEMEEVNVEEELEIIMEEINQKITNIQMILQMERYQVKLEKIIQIFL